MDDLRSMDGPGRTKMRGFVCAGHIDRITAIDRRSDSGEHSKF